MDQITIDKSELNNLIRENLINILKNRNDLLEIFEDIALGRLMEEGDGNEFVNEQEVFNILDNIK